jgi:hypothetical protein
MRPAEILDHDVGVVVEDLARVHQARRIEDRLDLAQNLVERVAVLPADETGPQQPVGVLSADRAAERPDQREDLVGHRPHLVDVARVAQVEVGSEVQLAVAGVAEERHGRAVLALDLLKAVDVFGQARVVDAGVLHELGRVLATPLAVEQRAGVLARLPDAGLIGGRGDDGPPRRLLAHGQVGHLDPLADLGLGVADVFDQQHRRGIGRQDVTIVGQLVDRQMNQGPVHQLARGRPVLTMVGTARAMRSSESNSVGAAL